jgi:hypothetical protein
MLSEISQMSELLNKYGAKGVIFSIIIFIGVSLLKSKWVSDFLSDISDKFVERFMKSKNSQTQQVKIITESDIINHDIFNYIDFWMYSKIPTIQFSTEYRTVVFRRYLTLFLKNYKRNLSEFVQHKDYQNMDESKMWKSLLDLINTIIYDYEREMSDTGIPKIIIEKMKSKNNDTISLTINLVEGICNSQFYESDKNYLKVYSILNIILSILENTISNSENVCNSINGTLRGLKFSDGDKTYIEP